MKENIFPIRARKVHLFTRGICSPVYCYSSRRYGSIHHNAESPAAFAAQVKTEHVQMRTLLLRLRRKSKGRRGDEQARHKKGEGGYDSAAMERNLKLAIG